MSLLIYVLILRKNVIHNYLILKKIIIASQKGGVAKSLFDYCTLSMATILFIIFDLITGNCKRNAGLYLQTQICMHSQIHIHSYTNMLSSILTKQLFSDSNIARNKTSNKKKNQGLMHVNVDF